MRHLGNRILACIIIVALIFGMIPSSMGQVQAASPKLSKTKVTMNAGTQMTLTVKNTKKSVQWKSGNTKIATVTKKGVVTAKKAGTVAITAKTAGKTLKCKVTVKAALNKTTLNVVVGTTTKLKVSGNTSTVKWSSTNKKVASVTTTGKVTAKSAGTATIKAKFAKTTLKCSVKVKKKLGTVSVDFTNAKIQTGSDNNQTLETYESTEKITGKTTVSGTTLRSIEYTLKNEAGKQTDSGKITPASSFSVSLKLTTGLNTLTVTAAGADGAKGSASLYITKLDSEVPLNSSVVTGDSMEQTDFSEQAVAISTETSGSGDDQIQYVNVLISKNSELYRKLKNGTLNKGDTYVLPAGEQLPTGMSGVIVSWKDSTESDYPGTSYVEVKMRSPSLDELFADDGSIKMSGIDEDDPVAFAMFADGSVIGDSSSLGTLSTLSTSDDDYTRNLFPDVSSASIKLSVSKSNGKSSVKLALNNLILYDFDSKRDTKDQIKLDGSVELADIDVDMDMDWNGGDVQYLTMLTSYTEKINVKISGDTLGNEYDLKKLIQDSNSSFENQTSLLGLKLSGVDMSDRLLLGVVGFNLGYAPGAVAINNLSEYAEKHSEPVLIAGIYLNLDGTITAEGSLSLDYSCYKEEGKAVVKNSYSQKDAIVNAKNYSTTKASGDYTIYSYDQMRKSKTEYSKPRPAITLEAEAKAELEYGLGVMAGVMIGGIIPIDIYGKCAAKSDGSLDGKVLISADALGKYKFDFSGHLKLGMKVYLKAGAEFNLKATAETKLFKFGGGISASWDIIDWTLIEEKFVYPLYKMTGGVYEYMGDTSNTQNPMANVKLELFDKDNLSMTEDTVLDESVLSGKEADFTVKTGTDGQYSLKDIPEGTYILRVSQNGFNSDLEEIELDSDKTKDIYLKEIRNENWLDICKPYQINNGNINSALYMGEAWGNTFTVSGMSYNIGFILGSGDHGSIPMEEALFNLEKKFSKLTVAIGHLDSSKIANGTLYVYLDGSDTPSQEISLDGTASKKFYDIDLNYAESAKFVISGTAINGFVNPQWAFVDGLWEGVDGIQGTIDTQDPFADTDWNSTNWLDICQPFLTSGAVKYGFDGSTGTFAMSGITYDNGFTLSTDDGGSFASFYTYGKFQSLDVTVGHVDGTSGLSTTLSVYLDGSSEASQTIALNASDTANSYTINLNRAKCVCLKIAQSKSNWSYARYGFANGTWNQ